MHNKFYFFCLLFLGFVACQRNVSKNLAAPTSNVIVPDSEIFELSQAYQDDMKKWQNDRFESVTAPHGWLSVIGLHWLKEGENKMGSGNNNDIVLPELASNYVGSIFLHDGKIRFKAYPESYVSLGYDNAFQQGEMKTDADGDPTVLNHQSLFFHVIKRGGQYGVRLKNTLARARFDLKEIPYFSLNPAMVFDAVTVPTSTMDSIEIRDVLGEVKNYSLESKLLFKRNGEIETLYAIDGGPDYYFVIFADHTSGKESYGGGRFLYVEKPKGMSETVKLDFNKSHNPPCVFTDFATCPLPPDENKLKFPIMAGEKTPEGH